MTRSLPTERPLFAHVVVMMMMLVVMMMVMKMVMISTTRTLPTERPLLSQLLFCRRFSPARLSRLESSGQCNLIRFYFATFVYIFQRILHLHFDNFCLRLPKNIVFPLQDQMQTSSATKSSAAASAIIALGCRRFRGLELRETILHLCRVLSSAWALRLTASTPARTSSSSFGGTERHAVGVNLASGERLDPGGVHLIGITLGLGTARISSPSSQ